MIGNEMSESNRSLTYMVTSKYWRRPVPCKICKRPSFSSYYAVRSCEGCKQFFRRVVINKKEYWCKQDGMCAVKSAATGENCLGCRLDRCLDAGMQPQMVNAIPADDEWSQFVERLEERRREIRNNRPMFPFENDSEAENNEAADDEENGDQENMKMVVDVSSLNVNGPALTNAKDWQQLDLLLLMAERQKNVWDAAVGLPPWLDQFQSPAELLHFPGCMLTAPKKTKSKDVVEYPNGHEVISYICIDALLLMDWIRTLPIFAELDTNDLLALLKHIHVPFAAICNSFYATLIRAHTWTRANGQHFHNEQLMIALKDEKLNYMSEKIFCNTVSSVKSLGIGYQEFVLLLAILCCNSDASDLSPAGRECLYNHATGFCRLLMAFLQQREGPFGGAKKFAECMHLLEQMMHVKHTFEMFSAYWAMSTFVKSKQQTHKHFEVATFPKALSIFFPF